MRYINTEQKVRSKSASRARPTCATKVDWYLAPAGELCSLLNGRWSHLDGVALGHIWSERDGDDRAVYGTHKQGLQRH